MPHSSDRRLFLKTGLAALAAGAAASGAHDSRAASSVPEAGAGVFANARKVQGFCSFCQSRCTYDAYVQGNRVLSIVGRKENRWTGGGMCPKGISLPRLMESPHRLTAPKLKVNGQWQDISYSDAVALVAEKLKEARARRGNKISGHIALTAPLWDCRESELAALMLMRLAGGANIMPPGEVCISTASSTLTTLVGTGNSTTTADELPKTETLVLWGANLAETYPPYVRWLDKAREAGVKIVVVDCRKTPTANWASMLVRPKPGTDGAVALGCLNYLFANKLYDAGYVESSTKNVEAVQEAAAPWTIEKAAEFSGVPPQSLEEFYKLIGSSKKSVIWISGSLNRYSCGMATIRSILAIQVIRNQIMGEGVGLLTMESGKPEGEKEFIDEVCGKLPTLGVNFRRLRASMEKGDIDVLFLNSSYRRYPDCNGVAEAIKKCGFVVYRGLFPTEELDVCDLYLPATFSLESQGSHYGAEKQVVWREKAVDAPGQCVPDWQFYRDVGREFAPNRYPDFQNPEQLCSLFSATVHEWKGITVERLRQSPSGLIGPIPEPNGPERLGCVFKDGKFRTADGKLDFAPSLIGPITYALPKDSPLDEKTATRDKYPLIFIQGKVVQHWQQTMTNFAPALAQFSDGRYVQIHPETAKQLNIANGAPVTLETAFGSTEAVAEVTESILPGVVFTPSHFTGASPFASTRGAPINTMLPNYWDRISAQFNGIGCAVRARS